jgi:hypothetical protein
MKLNETEGMRNKYELLEHVPKTRREFDSLGWLRRWWKNNIKMNLKEIDYDYVDWIYLWTR